MCGGGTKVESYRGFYTQENETVFAVYAMFVSTFVHLLSSFCHNREEGIFIYFKNF